MKLAVDNLAADATEDDLRTLFEIFGKVASVEIQRARGRGLVDMPSRSAAKDAITNLNGQELLGHQIGLSEFKPGKGFRPQRRRKRR